MYVVKHVHNPVIHVPINSIEINKQQTRASYESIFLYKNNMSLPGIVMNQLCIIFYVIWYVLNALCA